MQVKHLSITLLLPFSGNVTHPYSRRWYFPIICLAILLFFCSQSISVHAQNLDWAIGIGGSSRDNVPEIVVDANGNVYVAGGFADTVDFDPGPGMFKMYGGVYAMFLAKYDKDGNFIWARSIPGASVDKGSGSSSGLDIDHEGNVYVAGTFGGTVDFDPGPGVVNLTDRGGSYSPDIFFTKYDSNGNFLWAKSIGGDGRDAVFSLVVDAEYIHLAGSFNSGADFDPGSASANITSKGGADIFIAKYDTNGNYVWAIGMGSTGTDEARDIAVDTSGNVYVTGKFTRTVDFDPGPDTANLISISNSADIFVAKYDVNGNYIWAFPIGGNRGFDEGRSIALDESGYVCIIGGFCNTADFDPDPVDSAILIAADGTRPDVFIAKYDTDGQYIWAKSLWGPMVNAASPWALPDDYGNSIAIVNGNIYITGEFRSDFMDFDPGPDTAILRNTNSILTDMFIAKYDANGNYLWAKQVGGNSSDIGHSIAVHTNGDIYAGGLFMGIVDFDPGPDVTFLNTINAFQDGFIMKLSCGGPTAHHITTTICDTSYILNGILYTASGTYSQMYFAADGCDSIVRLDLSLTPIDKPVITTDSFTLGVTGTYTTYQWLLNGEPIPEANDPTYTVTENGNYQVVVTNEYGCSDTADVYTITNVGVDGVPVLANLIQVYPNPANDRIYIQSPVKVQVTLTDIAGRVIRKIETDARNISLKGLADGVYLLRISNKDGLPVKTEKIIKNRI